MAADFLLKVADVLDQAAAFVDGQDHEKQAAVKMARDHTIKDLAAQYTAATGDDLPDDVLEKLAASDEDILTTVSKLVAKSGAVESLGTSSDKTGSDHQPQSKAERVRAAYDNFGNFINS